VVEKLRAIEAHLRAFPDPATVFADPVERYARLLSPLMSVDLSAVNSSWSGWAPLVSPVEPPEGYLGDGTEEFHSYYARHNWVGFRLDDSSRLHLLGDWRYFLAESDDPEVRADQELVEHYRAEHEAYADRKRLFDQQGELSDLWDDDLCRVGGTVEYGWNWTSLDLFPLNTDNDEDVYPVAENGDRFYFVAHVPGWDFRKSGAVTFMFYEPNSRTVLFTFDWS